MELIVNGQNMNFSENSTIEDILNHLGVKEKVMATAVNMEIVKEKDWSKFIPKDGDKVEFLQFVGGG